MADQERAQEIPGGWIDPERLTLPELQPTYDGDTLELWSIALKNALFSFLTLGIFRFWGKTRLRRYVWSRVRIGLDRLEYRGTAGELGLGFVAVLLILGPPLAVARLAPHLVDGWLEYLLYGAYGATLLFLWDFAHYRARGYRLSRTSWRGLRFAQDGSALVYATIGLGGWALTLASLGLAWPVRSLTLEARAIRHTSFGDHRFSSEPPLRPLVRAWLPAWLLLIPSLGTSLLWYQAAQTRHLARHTRLGGLRFVSALRGRTLLAAALRTMGGWFASLCMVVGFVGICLAATAYGIAVFDWLGAAGDKGTNINLDLNATIGTVVSLALLLLCGAVATVTWSHGCLKARIESLELRGALEPEAISGVPGAHRRKEGLADLLEIGAL